ncbi:MULTISPECIES: TonB-dependent receptor [unclassified Novosphingobium]|uniref:TonB-dependent receptor n=1 Tax=unclassified Novosphingobium TaxID=2644732 RepID=UPI001447C1E7|nr:MULTISPECIES: TonB-dependent receptor [unclassified Novosphingobium]NKJ44905.1 iron complex outermembrane receptor protein [Novosphingobium sp. SG720]NMN07445.1 iron complex outermembrane receptor protein [Novosphingobium sp. SG919]NMN89770.1 iron complex outermembrane receptor protein [Novosphingobium sp. SG916]
MSEQLLNRTLLMTSAMMVLGYAGSAAAQAAPANTAAAVAADSNQVGVIVVTAQRRNEDIQKVPVSVQALSGQDLQSIGVKSTEDIAQATPNLMIQSPMGIGNQPLISIRGIGLNDFDSNNAGPNGVYIDDVYISAPSAQSFAIFDLDQVQVLKGPQGTLYGRNTSGGALLFTSKKPTDQLTADVHIEQGNYNTTFVTGAVGGPIADNLSARIAVVYNHSDGFMQNDFYGISANGTNSKAVRAQLLWKPTPNLKILLSSTTGLVNNVPNEYRHIGTLKPGTQSDPAPVVCSVADAYAGNCVDMFGFGTPSNFYRGQYNRTQYLRNLNLNETARIDYDLGRVTLTSISAFQHNDKYFPEDSDANPANLVEATFGVKTNTYTEELRAAYTSAKFNWVFGLYYLHEDLRQDQPLDLFIDGDLYGGFGIPAGAGNFDGIAQRAYDHSHQKTDSVAAFGQADYTLGNVTLTLGGRLTHERKTFEYDASRQYQSGGRGNFGPLEGFISSNQTQTNTNATWRAAVSYRPTDAILTYASVATGFKSGVFNGSFLSSDPEQALFQLQPVKPERVTAYEIGAKTSWFDRRLIFNVALFYNDYIDEQIFAQVPQTVNTAAGPIEQITQVLANAHKARTEGVEVELTAAPVRGLTFTLAPAWLNAKIISAGLPMFQGATPLDGNRLANAPRFSFSGTASYKIPLDALNGDLNFRWNSSYRSFQYFDSTNDPYITQSGYWIHNLNIVYQNKHGFDIGAYVRNVANKKYAIGAADQTAPFGMITQTVGAPRTYGVQVSFHY